MDFDDSKFFYLLGNIIPVKGYFRSIILDLQLVNFKFIPNDLFNLINKFNNKKVSEIYNYYNDKDTITEYLNFLLTNKYIFLGSSSYKNSFRSINTNWIAPAKITNCILDISSKTIATLNSIVRELDLLDCKSIQFRFLSSEANSIDLSLIFDITSSSRINSISLIIPFNEKYTDEYLLEHIKLNPRIHQIIIYNCESEENYFLIGFVKVIKVCNLKLNVKACGVISSMYFSPTIETFTEARHHNTCLNRKISIDSEGNIKNCPSMSQSFGNIRDTTLEEALAHPDFKKYWNIKKDDISKCKDCEFRYICTDCRAYIDDPDDMYSAPLKCGYDPYTGIWEEWSTNPLKQKAITYYGMEHLVASNTGGTNS